MAWAVHLALLIALTTISRATESLHHMRLLFQNITFTNRQITHLDLLEVRSAAKAE